MNFDTSSVGSFHRSWGVGIHLSDVSILILPEVAHSVAGEEHDIAFWRNYVSYANVARQWLTMNRLAVITWLTRVRSDVHAATSSDTDGAAAGAGSSAAGASASPGPNAKVTLFYARISHRRQGASIFIIQHHICSIIHHPARFQHRLMNTGSALVMPSASVVSKLLLMAICAIGRGWGSARLVGPWLLPPVTICF